MINEKIKSLKLGLFVIIATALLVAALYLIGNTRNLFGKTFTIKAQFYNVNGLMPGHNVRFAGIDVGTVKSVTINSDTSVLVEMVIEEKVRTYIKKNALVSVGTDGLVGNKLVNINSVAAFSESVEEGDVLQTLRPIESDEMMRTLNTTNENIKVISENLKNITQRISNSNSLWSLLMDTTVSTNLKTAIVNIKLAGKNTAVITGDLSAIVDEVRKGKGTVGALLTDTLLSGRLEQAIINIDVVSNEMAVISGDFKKISDKINAGEGSIGTLLMDTTFVHNLNKSLENINTGATEFTDVMEGLKHSVFLRRYFKKKEKQENKNPK